MVVRLIRVDKVCIIKLYGFFGGVVMKETKPEILIIDDEKRMLASLRFLLEKDFNVLTASGGGEGLVIFNAGRISLILLDIDMPVMNGIEVLQRIRSTDKFVKVIMMTGKSSHDWAKRCADLNVQGYVEKPFEPGELIERIKEMLEKKGYPVLKKLWGTRYEERMRSLSIQSRRTLLFIEQNCRIALCRDCIADHLQITPDYLSRFFHRECGIELHEYIHMSKIEKSKEYLSKKLDMKIKEVAEAIGISDTAYFCRFFKHHTGLTPKEFRKNSFPC